MAYLIISRKKKWTLVHRQYSGNKILKTRTILLNSPEAERLGLFASMDEADAKQTLLLRRNDLLAQRAVKCELVRLKRQAISSAWLPEELVQKFGTKIGTRNDRWLIVKELIATLNTPPYEWASHPEIFYKFFEKNKWSMDYIRRLLRIINLWGDCFCRALGKDYDPINAPTGQDRTRIKRANYSKPSRATTSLSIEDLTKCKALLSEYQYNSLYIAFWLGLRREELLSLHDVSQNCYIDKDRRGFYVFHLFQKKLERSGVEPRLCWKAIPLVELEQQVIPELISQKKYEFVSAKRLKRCGVLLTNRSARKGFSIEMEIRGYSKDCIEAWLGHVGNSTRAKHYQDKRIAVYSPPVVWELKTGT